MSKITKSRLFELLSARHLNNPYSRLADLPSPEKFKDIDIACKRIKKAILEKETITIVGDYDVDGVVSTTIMLDFFNTIKVKVNHIIPNRFEHGYGLSTKIVDLIDEGLVITVDNGISAYEASVKLKEKNIDLIITDHHTVGKQIPIALAIINPKQADCNFEFKDICGAQVAWYLCAAIKKEMNLDVNMSNFLDLLCVAIIADIMPMTALNYTIVKQGLKKIKTSSREAFKKLNEIMSKEIFVSASNSIEFASSSPNTFLANSIIANCIPRQIPRYGILFSLAYLIAASFPSTPLCPNPPATKIASEFPIISNAPTSSILSLSHQ